MVYWFGLSKRAQQGKSPPSIPDTISSTPFFYDETRPHSQFPRELVHEPIKPPDTCAHIFLGCLTEEPLMPDATPHQCSY